MCRKQIALEDATKEQDRDVYCDNAVLHNMKPNIMQFCYVGLCETSK